MKSLSIQIVGDSKNPNFEKWIKEILENNNFKFLGRKYHVTRNKVYTLIDFQHEGRGDRDFIRPLKGRIRNFQK